MPRPLRPGSVVAVVAPATGFDREELLRGLAWLRTRYRLRIDRRIFDRRGYLAWDDESRAAVLARVMVDPAVDAIACARGGYGTMRLLEHLPWDAFVARPKWLFGFSDVTALHVELARRGVGSLHGPNVTGLGRAITPLERARLLAVLEGRPPSPWRGSGLDVLVPGSARGPLVGGNLTLLAAMAAAGRLVVPRGAILVVEDVTEAPYRVDRMWTSLRLGGHLDALGAIVLGTFARCDPGPDGVTVDDVLSSEARAPRGTARSAPAVRGAPFGHATRNEAFPLGAAARLEADVAGWSLHWE
jgi:muramoyltetrapeptide carboxypeptidase